MKTLAVVTLSLLFCAPLVRAASPGEVKEKKEPSKPSKEVEMDPEKEGHSHGEDEYKRRAPSAHGKDRKLCTTWGYCFPSGHDPAEWRAYLPEDITLHACPKIASCHPEKEEHEKRYCGDENGQGARNHCDQSCREQCCFCCGSP